MLRGIDNVGICVADLARSVAFYEQLGFARVYENDRGVTLAAGGLKLFVFQTRRSPVEAVARALRLFENAPGIDHLSFAVDDVDRMHADLSAWAIRFEIAPADQTWGARIAALRDPDGNNLYLLQWLAAH